MTASSRRRLAVSLVAAAAAVTAVTAATSDHAGARKPSPQPVPIQILALNDFHGQLEVVDPVASSGGRIGSLTRTSPTTQICGTTCIPAGGAEYLATHVRNMRAENPNTVFVSAGDVIGATPLLSALFHDEPTIEAMDLMGLDYNGVGNHEFDEGVTELLRMQYGPNPGRRYEPARPDGCHPVDGCGDEDPFGGAGFDFLAANVTYKDNGKTIFPPYAVHTFDGGYKVAFVGMTLDGTPLIVSPDGIKDVDFLPEAATVNALVPELKRRGVEAIVVLLHEGGTDTDTQSRPTSNANTNQPTDINNCSQPQGDIVPIVNAFDTEIDLVVTGHTNWAINCRFPNGIYVTGAASQGRLVTDIDATLDPRTGDFASIAINNEIVTQDVPKAADITALMDEYRVFSDPIANVRVGEVSVPMDRGVRTFAGESTLGRLIADAQLASARADGHASQIAFMNPGGIRANLDGVVTYGEAFAVQPFSNVVTSKTMTGTQIDTLLEQQFTVNSLANPSVPGGTLRAANSIAILQVSAGFTYTYDGDAPAGQRVDPLSIKLDGVTLDPNGTYRVTMNNFLASGGDDFPVFTVGTNPQIGDDDLVALVEYLDANDPYTPITTERITRID